MIELSCIQYLGMFIKTKYFEDYIFHISLTFSQKKKKKMPAENQYSLLVKQSSSSSSKKSYQSIQQDDDKAEEKNQYLITNDEEFTWTQEEESQVLHILDKYLMMFILLMSLTLNMDRTNLCKLLTCNSSITYSLHIFLYT